jgi:hypothetical protein
VQMYIELSVIAAVAGRDSSWWKEYLVAKPGKVYRTSIFQ